MKNQTHPIADYLKPFLLHFLPLEKGASRNTVLSYRDTIRLLLCFAADTLHKSVDALTAEDLNIELILAFLDYLESDRGCTANTRNQRLAALRSLFKYIGRQAPELLLHVHQVCSISMKTTEEKTMEYLTSEELSALTGSIDQSTDLGCRDYALVLLLFNTGARVSELVNLKISDIVLTGSPKINIMGKGKKPRACVLWNDTVKALRAHLELRSPRKDEDAHVFLNAVGTPLTRFGVTHILKKYAEIAKDECPSIASKNITPHVLRHSTAMHLLIIGIDVAMIALWLG
ncbi:MAG: site-specific integrase, partial [Deltaproteobacteria bacterium]|nr:site-specific integrase [Deltaproteobacteria bacterium]